MKIWTEHYRVYCAYAGPGEAIEEFARTPPTFAPAVKAEVAAVEHVVRVFEENNTIVRAGEKTFSESHVHPCRFANQL